MFSAGCRANVWWSEYFELANKMLQVAGFEKPEF